MFSLKEQSPEEKERQDEACSGAHALLDEMTKRQLSWPLVDTADARSLPNFRPRLNAKVTTQRQRLLLVCFLFEVGSSLRERDKTCVNC